MQDLLHFKLPKEDIFVFRDGTFVHWGGNVDIAQNFYKKYIEECEDKKYEHYEMEDFHYIENDEKFKIHNLLIFSASYIVQDTILLGTQLPHLNKLAFSHGLARSVKLSILENMLEVYLEPMTQYALLLKQGQTILLNNKEIMAQIGTVLYLRGILNLQPESFLDTPDYYWSQPELELIYDQINRNLDVVPRIKILNKKLDYAKELANMLRDQLSETHSRKLEWSIIVLIAINVLFELLHFTNIKL